MGVGQPLSMKLKNVHLPHLHPNGSFWDTSLGGGLVLLPSGSVSVSSSFSHTGSKLSLVEGLVLPWYLAAVALLAAASAGVVMLSWVRTSVERGIRCCYSHNKTCCAYTHNYFRLVQWENLLSRFCMSAICGCEVGRSITGLGEGVTWVLGSLSETDTSLSTGSEGGVT